MDTRNIGNRHLPNLDPLRFFAAAIVSFYHTDMVLVSNGYKKDYYYFFPFQHGDIAVVFFFVLSGFLITWLLLNEKKNADSISVRKFYLKRIFRIWPLYFLMIILVFGYLNSSNYFHIVTDANTFNIKDHLILNIIFLLLISPNLVLLNTNSLVYGNPTWSIGVEEQFYLIWPWIIKSKNALMYIFFIILSVFVLSNGMVGRLLQSFVSHGLLTKNALFYKILFYLDKLFTFGYAFKIDAMAIGALGSYMVYNNSSLLKIIYPKKFQIFIYIILLLLMILHHVVVYQFYAIIFILIIVNVSNNSNSILNIKSATLNYLGKVSYGIYMFHLIAIVPAIKLVTSVWGLSIGFFSEMLICFISLAMTIIIAVISFNTFEKIFFNIKISLLAKNK